MLTADRLPTSAAPTTAAAGVRVFLDIGLILWMR
jgi:hypothetical protein